MDVLHVISQTNLQFYEQHITLRKEREMAKEREVKKEKRVERKKEG